jgi:hypothetical protein
MDLKEDLKIPITKNLKQLISQRTIEQSHHIVNSILIQRQKIENKPRSFGKKEKIIRSVICREKNFGNSDKGSFTSRIKNE